MAIGDLVYLKSGGVAMTVISEKPEEVGTNWFGGATVYSGVFPPETLISTNPTPAINDATRKLDEALNPPKPATPVV